jgi:transposase
LKEICRERNINIKYLPPYSPFLNPIENLFSKWKSLVRSFGVSTEEELMQRIESAAFEISGDDCDGYFRNMLRYLLRCMNGEEIYD